jgi:hypothetical protein
VTTIGSPLRCGTSTGDDLVVEEAVLLRLGRELVRARGELVLLLAADAQLGVVALRRVAHRALVEGAEQAVVRHGVEHLDAPYL